MAKYILDVIFLKNVYVESLKDEKLKRFLRERWIKFSHLKGI